MRMKTEDTKNSLIRNGGDENEGVNALKNTNDNENNKAKASFLQIFLNNKNFFFKKNASFVNFVFYFISKWQFFSYKVHK